MLGLKKGVIISILRGFLSKTLEIDGFSILDSLHAENEILYAVLHVWEGSRLLAVSEYLVSFLGVPSVCENL